jgi:RecG-like helicase
MRGPGELTGTRQWGPAAFRFADLVRDRQVIAETRRLCAELGSDEIETLRAALAPSFPVDERWVRG